jgi:hypothetical protein
VYICGVIGPVDGEGEDMPAAAVEAATVSAFSAFSVVRLVSMEIVLGVPPECSVGVGAAESVVGAVRVALTAAFL